MSKSFRAKERVAGYRSADRKKVYQKAIEQAGPTCAHCGKRDCFCRVCGGLSMSTMNGCPRCGRSPNE